jgi:hypothetical protein
MPSAYPSIPIKIRGRVTQGTPKALHSSQEHRKGFPGTPNALCSFGSEGDMPNGGALTQGNSSHPGLFLGHFYENWVSLKTDAALRHFVELHPGILPQLTGSASRSLRPGTSTYSRQARDLCERSRASLALTRGSFRMRYMKGFSGDPPNTLCSSVNSYKEQTKGYPRDPQSPPLIP